MKSSAPMPVPAAPNETEIQHRAYLLWLEGGCRPGCELEDWHAARELLHHHHGRAPVPARNRSAKRAAVTSR